MCNSCGCKSAENFEAKPYGDSHKRDFYTVAHGKTEEPRFAEVYETFETWDEAYKEANRLSRFTDGEYVFVFSPKDASPYVIEPQNKDYFGAYDDSISERQEWLIGELGGKVDKSMNRSKASDYIKELQGKESGTWKDAETVDFSGDRGLKRDVLDAMDALAILRNRLMTLEGKEYDEIRRNEWKDYTYEGMIKVGGKYAPLNMTPENIHVIITSLQEQYLGHSAEGFEADMEYVSVGSIGEGENARDKIMELSFNRPEGEGWIWNRKEARWERKSKRKGSHAPNIELITYEDVLREKMKNQNMKDAETFEANEEAVEQTDANMVNEGSVEAFYGGGAKVSVSSAGIQPTANPSVDEAFDVGNQVGLDVAEQEIMNENPSVEVNYGGEDMSLRESAKLGFGVGAGLLGFNVALLGIATIGGFLLNRD